MTSSPPPDEDEPPSQAAQAVRALLDRHGIPKHRQSTFVGEFFNLSRAAAHRRVHSTAAWTIDELQTLAEKFGESLPEMLGGGRAKGGTRATLQVGEVRAPCRVWFADGDELGNATFVAVESAGAYKVVPADSVPKSSRTRQIARFEIDQTIGPPARIAVLDDDKEVTKTICAVLREKGYEPVGFSAANALIAEIQRSPFDGYILDWKVRGGNALPVVAKIREQAVHGAIALLSGRLRDGSINTAEVAAASSQYNFRVFEKPAQIEFIIAALESDGLESPRAPDSR
ncbi:helix-turn-helix domain-containing protein [Variovorax sp. LjRoot130]|uniref:helix-turn-helix domain-containing protein n=1 Tax=Variovorax sp. LjRoot130 TaxID=3342261 RepID=UPI003ECDCBC0